jgi:hypothetical protein
MFLLFIAIIVMLVLLVLLVKISVLVILVFAYFVFAALGSYLGPLATGQLRGPCRLRQWKMMNCLLLWVRADSRCQLYSNDSFDQVEFCLSVCPTKQLKFRQRESVQ